MNKPLIVLLAVCLISVHGFVKREAETPDKTQPDILNQFQEVTNTIGEKLKETFNPEQIKKGFNDIVDQLNKGIQDFNTKYEGAKQ